MERVQESAMHVFENQLTILVTDSRKWTELLN